jgi:hypothetical protein
MNNKNKNSIDQLFSEKLQNHSVKPRDLVWENLDKQLGKKKGGASRKYWALGALLLLSILGTGGVFFGNFSEQENQVKEQKTQIPILLEVQKTETNESSTKSAKLKNNTQVVIVHKKEENKIEKNTSAIQTTTIHTTKKKAINLSTKKENKTIKKQAVATPQTPVKKEEVVTDETSEIQNSEELEEASEEEIQKIAKNDESEAENALETNTEKQETKKAGVRVTIRLGTQAGGRDEEREEIEAEEQANKKSRLLGKVLKGAWNLKKEKKLGKKNK